MARRPVSGPGERLHIGLYGRVNVGKSSLMNTLTGQHVSIVSASPGTTTDVVKKSMELPGLGVCVVLDTAGLDDHSALAGLRMEATRRSLDLVDVALLVIRANVWDRPEEELVEHLAHSRIPFLVVHTAEDEVPLRDDLRRQLLARGLPEPVPFSARDSRYVGPLVSALEAVVRARAVPPGLLDGLVGPGELIILVTPIDAGAPQGRLILPQVQALRAALDLGAIAVVVQPEALPSALSRLGDPPDLVITDSQVFAQVAQILGPAVPLTSFSMLLARQKGELDTFREGVTAMFRLRDQARGPGRILILEGCTHHASCDDIGRVKLPRWLDSFLGTAQTYDVIPGLEALSRELGGYRLALICGGCVLTSRQLRARVDHLRQAGVPVVNYGMAIAVMQGIYPRAMRPFLRDRG